MCGCSSPRPHGVGTRTQITLNSLSGAFCQGLPWPRPTRKPEAEEPSGVIQSLSNLNKLQQHPQALVKHGAGPHRKLLIQ